MIPYIRNQLRRLFTETLLFIKNNCNYLFFAALLLVITLSIPYSGDGQEVQTRWSDQSLFLDALKEALAGTTPPSVVDGEVGSGYIALGVFTAKILNLAPTDALVILNRCSFILTVLVCFAISHSLLHKQIKIYKNDLNVYSNNKIDFISSFVSFVYILTIVLFTNFIAFSDIPWSHFPAALLVLICILATIKCVEFKHSSYQYVWLSILGSALGLLLQVRFFEGLIFTLVIIIWILILLIRSKKERIKTSSKFISKYLPCSVLLFIITSYATLITTNTKTFQILYLTLGKNRPFVREITRLYLYHFPVKFVQLFIDPNFFTLEQSYKVSPIIFGFNFGAFYMPLVLQLPILIYLIPCIILLIVITFCIKKDISLILSAEFFIPLLVGTGLILGYVSSAAAGSPHLKYGFVRDFMSPTWCFAIVMSPWSYYRYIYSVSSRIHKLMLVFSPVLPILFTIIIYTQILFKIPTFLQFNYFHINNFDLSHNCNGLECSFSLKMYNSTGQLLEAPWEKYIVTSFCSSTEKEVAVTLSSQKQKFKLPFCPESYEVKIFPVNMGFASTPDAPISWIFKSEKPISYSFK